jgi:hypothetical protein
MRSNLLQVAFFTDCIGMKSQAAVRRKIPYHIIIGPLPEDYRYEVFLSRHEVSRHFCHDCQMVG